MHREIRDAFERALSGGYAAMAGGDFRQAYQEFERAHVIGQRWLWPHARSHWAFLIWGWRQRDAGEILGQCLRLPAGMVGSLIGRLPIGNTGGAKVSATRPMPLPEDIERLFRGE